MDSPTQSDRARAFRERHHGSDPLVLANAWDVASALVYEAAGFEAIGTTSAGIAAALGVPDGERLEREEMLAVVDRIAHAVDLPVSADVEAGYGDDPAAVAETVRRTIDAGAVGVNLEDGTGDPDAPLVDAAVHADAIAAAREAAEAMGVPLVINGRTDVFWLGVGDESTRLDHAVERATLYAEAGSDCLFVPGVTDPATIEALTTRLDAPLNVLGGPGAPSIPDLGRLGVARVSVGSGPMRATLGCLREICSELRERGTYQEMTDAVPYAELNDLLAASVERRSRDA